MRASSVRPHCQNTEKYPVCHKSTISVRLKSTKKPLMLDFRYVKRHIFKQKIKFEDWNGVLGLIEIAPHRATKLLSTLREVLRQEKISSRNLASVIGQIISTGPVTGNLSEIMS